MRPTGGNARGAWSLAGLAAGVAGLATSYFCAEGLTIRESPVVAIADVVVRHTPGPVAEKVITLLKHGDKPFLVIMILLLSAAIFAWAGRLARHSSWAPVVVYVVMAALGGAAVASQRGAAAVDALPVVAGFVTWLVCLSLLTEPLRRVELAQQVAEDDSLGHTGAGRRGAAAAVAASTRRAFVVRAALMGAAAVALAGFGRVVGRGRRQVEEARRLLKISQVTEPVVPVGARLPVPGISSWQTAADAFYRIDTTIVTPTIAPNDWSLRIHGMVDREITLNFDQLVARELTEAWVTIGCVSNEIGGDLIGNAWWSGVRIAPLLAEAGVQAGADAVKQTSSDGWTCGTPLEALTDDRNAMLAVAMNGEPLPIEHGFPVRTIVPGLYGYVSATKWVAEFEVTKFSEFQAFWTQNGWSERGPVKISSRIDLPRNGAEVKSGMVRLGGLSWAQHTGIGSVEVAIDGGPWTAAQIGGSPSSDTWVEWTIAIDLEPGDHLARVRATDRDGNVQVAARHGTVPDGATGLDQIDFKAT